LRFALDVAGGPTGVDGFVSGAPALTWERLLARILMMALIGALALQRLV
jgi:hypothetical protein